MDGTGRDDIDQAHHLVDVGLSVVRQIPNGQFWRILPDDLLSLGRQLEELARTVYAAQLHLTGESDARRLADAHSCSSTPALLRQALNISNADAISRVKAARHILPRETPTGAELPPSLPLLGDAVESGRLGSEHIRTVVETMDKIPPTVPEPAFTACEQALVDTAASCDPNYLGRAAQRILERVDPDGDYDGSTPDTKMSIDFGGRNIRTGLTPIKGHLDDHGV